MAVDPFDPANYAQDEAAADALFAQWRSRDPFPEVQPALLNTADLLDYIRVTGMVSPFAPDTNHRDRLLKPASCAIPMGKEYLYWEEIKDLELGGLKNAERHDVLAEGEALVLKRNSIVYVALASTFRIPDYIAARFNLTIEHVYKGLLVGTGPLVDPGFNGNLYLPLHNLTSNDYPLIVGEPIVWMEFTKLSPHESWTPNFTRSKSSAGQERVGEYVGFPDRKRTRRRLRDYTWRAWPGPITSSIPSLFGRAQQAAEAAEAIARRIQNWGGVAVLVALAAIIALAVQVLTFQHGQSPADLRSKLARVENREQTLAREFSALQAEAMKLKADLARARRPPPRH